MRVNYVHVCRLYRVCGHINLVIGISSIEDTIEKPTLNIDLAVSTEILFRVL